MKKNNKGFSLVELIVVVLILGILAVAVTPQIMNWVDTSKKNTDKTTVESIEVAAQAAVLEWMEKHSVGGEVYKVTGGDTPTITDDGSDSNVDASGDDLDEMILKAIGAVAAPKENPTHVYQISVAATSGQVSVSIVAPTT